MMVIVSHETVWLEFCFPAIILRSIGPDLVVLTNPKAALMWVAVSMFLATTHGAHAALVLIGGMAAISAMVIYGTYAVLFSTGVAVRAYQRFFRTINGLFGAVFGVIGGRLLIDGLRVCVIRF